MNKSTLMILALAAAAAGTSIAGPLFSLSPAIEIAAPPGYAAGWGFDLQGDSTDYLSVVSVFVLSDSNPLLGFFTDFLSPQGGPVNGVLAPGQDWSESYDSAQMLGFGEYAIDPAAAVGDTDTGQFLIQYQLFSGDPNVCGGCYVSSGQFIQDFQVTAAPEPGTLGMMGIGGLLCALAWRRRGRSLQARQPF